MVCNIVQNWAASGITRTPTAGEWASGFTCGAADPDLFNWLFQAITECIQDHDARLDILEAVGVVTATRGVKATTVLGSPNITTITSTLGDGSRPVLLSAAIDPEVDLLGLWDVSLTTMSEATAFNVIDSVVKASTGISVAAGAGGTIEISATGGGGAPAASQGEVDAGTVADEYVAPLTFKNASIPASQTFQGRIEIATQAEANIGTDFLRAITPATLAGYVGAQPAGQIVAFGRVAGVSPSLPEVSEKCSISNPATGSVTITLDVAQPNTNYIVMGEAGQNGASAPQVTAQSASAFTLTVPIGDQVGMGFYVVAL